MDGVSLEINKWKTVLEEMGHKVYLLSGETSSLDATIIPELHLANPEISTITPFIQLVIFLLKRNLPKKYVK